ncbi:MAG: hypothetical protein V7752_06855 [Halopseudomonas sp.]
MSKLTACSLFLAASLPSLAMAEPIALRCVYTQASFNAAYMSQAETRACPQSRCFYDLRFDTESGTGSVNAVEGYALTIDDSRYQLDRQAKNVIVGGVDSASFTVNRQDLRYSSIKSTPPGVSLETVGQCQPVE